MADYVFRYRLDGGAEPVYHSDPLLEMLRAQLESILNVVILVEGQREVKVDGFKLLRDPGSVYRIFPPGKQPSDCLE